ncbi:MAG: AI-2E family transporter [Vicinamibacterales bacterium]
MAPDSSRAVVRYAVACTAIAIVLMWALYLIRAQVLLFYVSALFATGLAPLVRLIERRRIRLAGKRQIPRAAAILAIYGTVLALLAALGAAVVPPLVDQGRQLWNDLPARFDLLQQKLVEWGVMPDGTSFAELLKQAPVSGGTDAVTTVLVAIWSIVGGVFGIVTILLLTFYLLVDSEHLFNVFVRLFPRSQRQQVANVGELMAVKISAWLGGQILLGFIIGIISAIGLALLGVPYFFVLAVIAGVGEMIPMVGPLLAAIPAVAVAFTVSPSLGVGVALFCWGVQLVENNFLVPKVMSQQVGLSAITVIVALIIGSSLLGLAGALLAVPTAAILQVLFEELVLEKEPG